MMTCLTSESSTNEQYDMNDWRELKLMTKALGDIARLAIVYHLARQAEITVTALTDMLGLSQPLVSWHLRKLRRAGLIRTRRLGRQVYCSLDIPRYQQCLQYLAYLIDPTIQLEELPAGEALAAEAMGED
ncbi:MAG: ArsR/SmtB family transcription factor [Ktedonobacteraceae bacterium]